jgi:hypothetical protein
VLHQAGAEVTEVDRPTRRARRNGKSDPIDALLAAGRRWRTTCGVSHAPTAPVKRHACC